MSQLEPMFAAALNNPIPKHFTPVFQHVCALRGDEQAASVRAIGAELESVSLRYVEGVLELILSFLNANVDLTPLLPALCRCLERPDLDPLLGRVLKTLVFNLENYRTARGIPEGSRELFERLRSHAEFGHRALAVLMWDASLSNRWSDWLALANDPTVDVDDAIGVAAHAFRRGHDLSPIVPWLEAHGEDCEDLLAQLELSMGKVDRAVAALCADNDSTRGQMVTEILSLPTPPALGIPLVAAIEHRRRHALYGIAALARKGYAFDPDVAAHVRRYLDDPELGRHAAMTLLALKEPCDAALRRILAAAMEISTEDAVGDDNHRAGILVGLRLAFAGGADVAPLLPSALPALEHKTRYATTAACRLITELAKSGVDCGAAVASLVTLSKQELADDVEDQWALIALRAIADAGGDVGDAAFLDAIGGA